MAFLRSLTSESINVLKEEELFTKKLFEDCQKGEVFPAVRQNRVDFYHKGGKLFAWEKGKGFSTHHKYASVLHPEPKDYILESDLRASTGKFHLITDFCEGYSRIKENCSLYSGVESAGVSELYHRFSLAAKPRKDVVVVDIEVAFNKEDESNCEIDINSGKLGKKGNRIDIVTLERSTRKLRFFEAKHYTNRASLRNEERIPALCEQLSNYDSELRAHDKDIIEAYKNQIFAVNILFDTDIPLPSEIDYTTRAVIFGFDDEQKA